MKTMLRNSIVILTLLLVTSFAKAQEATVQFEVGDTVLIKDDMKRYLTGEEPSKWVYFVKHSIMQVGTIKSNKWPNGILLREIYSWVGPEGLVLAGSEEGRELARRRGMAVSELSEEERRQLEAYANRTRTTIIEGQEETPEPPQEEPEPPVVVEEPQKEETAKVEVAPEEPKEPEMTRLDRMHRFSIGVRGGLASLMQNTKKVDGERKMDNGGLGFDAYLDVQYTFLAGGKKVNPGIMTGISLGFERNGIAANNVNENWTVTAPDGGNINYSTSIQRATDKDWQLMLEIPVMFAMVTKNGFFMNVGPRFQIPVLSRHNQKLTAAEINAEFVNQGVTVPNEAITGLVTADQAKKKGSWKNANIQILLGAELGYEWLLKNGDGLGLGAYGNYGLWDNFKDRTPDNPNGILSVTPAQNDGSAIAGVEVVDATNAYVTKIGNWDAGLKLVYHFCWRKAKK